MWCENLKVKSQPSLGICSETGSEFGAIFLYDQAYPRTPLASQAKVLGCCLQYRTHAIGEVVGPHGW